MSYVDLKYKPSKNDLICSYYLEPARDITIEKACEQIAGESSIETWTKILTLSPKMAQRLKPHVFQIDKRKGQIKIAYTDRLFEWGNMPGILASVAGNIFGMKDLKNLRLLDIVFPKSIVNSFKGPKFGIGGIRKLLKVKDRALVGTIIKPKVGLSSIEHAKVAYKAWVGGIDLVKDDENLTSLGFNLFEKRLARTLELRDKAQEQTGERKAYIINITAETNKMLERAQLVKDQGGEYAMVDVITVGWAGLQTLRNANESLKLVLHGHRTGHAAIDRNPKHGITMAVIAKLNRIIGIDELHIGTVVGKMAGRREEVLANVDALTSSMYGLRQAFPVASGGLHPGLVPALLRIFGNDVILQFGGGVHGNPLGTEAGAKAVRQAICAVERGILLKECAKEHKELKAALDKWCA